MRDAIIAETESPVLLSTEWRHLLMFHYPVEPGLLQQYVPRGTELDLWQGTAYLSLVGLLFLDLSLMDIRLPFLQKFEEVNLRFYVRSEGPDGDERHGTVFLRQIVPRLGLSIAANLILNESYVTLPMDHTVVLDLNAAEGSYVRYAWQMKNGWNSMNGTPAGDLRRPEPGTLEDFLTNKPWVYTAQREGGTLEYQVEHPPWLIQSVQNPQLDGELAGVEGHGFLEALSRPPEFALLADGSPSRLYTPQSLFSRLPTKDTKEAPVSSSAPPSR